MNGAEFVGAFLAGAVVGILAMTPVWITRYRELENRWREERSRRILESDNPLAGIVEAHEGLQRAVWGSGIPWDVASTQAAHSDVKQDIIDLKDFYEEDFRDGS